MLDIYVTRRRFIQLVGADARTCGSGRLALNSNSLREICKANRLPMQRRSADNGEPMDLTSRLAPRELGQNPYIHVVGDFDAEERRRFFEELLAEPFESLEPMAARFRKRMNKINMSADPFGIHPAIFGALALSESGALHAEDANGGLDGVETRRLHLLNEIFAYAGAVGGRCRFAGPGDALHTLTIGHTALLLRLSRSGKSDGLRLEIAPPSQSGGGQLCWADNGGLSLEHILPAIMVQIGEAAEAIIRQLRDDWHKWSPFTANRNVEDWRMPATPTRALAVASG